MPNPKGHAYYRDLLEMHLEGDIAPPERMVLFEHLEFCDECRRTLEAEERLSQRLKAVPKLVAPSDLRASIVKQAMQDRKDRVTPVIEDERLAPVLRAAPTAQPDEQEDDLPVFAGVTRPRPSRVRFLWRQASPYAAYTFVACAASAALYSGAFRGVPGADRLEATLRSGVREIALLTSGDESRAKQTEAPGWRTTPSDAPAPANGRIPRMSETKALADARVVDWAARIQRRAAVARATLSALAVAAERPLPAPAENARAQIAALVLRSTDSSERMSFERDELGEAIRQARLLETQTGGGAQPDQFAYAGHRYRTYVVRVAENRVQDLVRCLERYRAPEDRSMLRVLSEQNRLAPRAPEQVAFYESTCDDLRHALTGCTAEGNTAPHLASATLRPLQIIVVE